MQRITPCKQPNRKARPMTKALFKSPRVSYETNMDEEDITQAEYRAFQQAYDFFNAELFGGSLPPVLVTLQRHAKARGYFAPERFTGRTANAAAHELAMNPDCLDRKSTRLNSSHLGIS